MTGRPDGDYRQQTVADEDDWFSTPPVEPTDLPTEVAWQDEPELSPRTSDGLGRRQAVVVLAAIAAVAVGAAGILLARSLGGSDDTPTTVGSTAQAPTTPTASTPATSTPETTTPTKSATSTATLVPTDVVLRPGSSGAGVTALQQALTSLGYAPGTADGSYGPTTTQAVSAFQTANGLTADGIGGAKTIAAINAALESG